MSDSELESLKCGPNDGGRRNNKPLMERRRRARINTCLNQLKTLVLEAMKKDTSRYSKLEKADILEMTVRYLRNVQRSRMTVAFSTDPSVVAKYRAGFNECAREVSRYLDSVQVDGEVRSRLMNHLATSVTSYTQSPSQRQQQVPVMQPIHVQIPAQQPNTTFLNNPGFMQNGQTVFAAVADNAETVKNLQYVPAAIGPDGRVTYLLHSPHNQKPITRGLAPVTRGLAPVTLANINAAYPRSQVYSAPTEYPHIAMDAPDMPTDLSMNSCSPMSCSSASTPPSTPMSMRLVTKIRPSIVKREPVWRPW